MQPPRGWIRSLLHGVPPPPPRPLGSVWGTPPLGADTLCAIEADGLYEALVDHIRTVYRFDLDAVAREVATGWFLVNFAQWVFEG